MLSINRQLINMNYSKGRSISPQYIVFHETDNESRGADAMANRNYFANHEEAQASTHFVVDDHQIVQCAELDWRCWHVGDNSGYSNITNSNSVGIEICVNADGDYNKALENAIDLGKYLMGALGLGIDRVVMHNTASGKHCPRRILDNGTWNWFKSRINGSEVSSPTYTNPSSSYSSQVSEGAEFVGLRCTELQQLLINKGYDCGGYGADGQFGNGTLQSLLQYQSDNGLTSDGLAGEQTFASLYSQSQQISQPQSSGNDKVLRLQRLCNQILGSGLAEDGIYGNLTDSAISRLPLCGLDYTQPELTKWVQSILGIDCDGIFWYGTEASVKEYQNSKRLSCDGIIGYNSYKSLATS